jgi:hypothetical protein
VETTKITKVTKDTKNTIESTHRKQKIQRVQRFLIRFLRYFVVPGYRTLALTDALPVKVNVQLFLLLPPLEQAPDQIASRPFDTLNVIEVPVVKDAEPVLPTATLIPAGADVMREPLRPVAVTVNVAV